MFSASKSAAPSNNLNYSLRFRSAAYSGMYNSPLTDGNQTTYTLSCWVKRGKLGTVNIFVSATDEIQYSYVGFNASNNLEIFSHLFNSDPLTVSYHLITTATYQDPTVWNHVVLSVDTTQADQSNRINLYVNGVQITSYSTAVYPNLNDAGCFNSSLITTCVGFLAKSTGNQYFDGYVAELNLNDGQQLLPTAYGQFNNNVWIPIAYTGTFGTNGFYLKFNHNDTLTTIGFDNSGNNNSFVAYNMSLSAGPNYDSMLDWPSSVNPISGNYCILNPLIGNSQNYFSITSGNLGYTLGSGTTYTLALGSSSFITGKWYWEVTIATVGTTAIGVSPNTIFNNSGPTGTCLAFANNGTKYVNGSVSSYASAYTSNDVIGVAYDASSGKITFYKNGTTLGLAATERPVVTGFFPCIWGVGASGYINFGQQPFAYNAPVGFNRLNSYNLSKV
jgi:hypothetical protein